MDNGDRSGPGGPGKGGPGGPGGGRPYGQPAQPALSTGPIYLYSYLARYTGNGDPKDAANYEPVKSPVALPQVFDTLAATLIGSDNQKFYHVANGRLVAGTTK